MVAMLKLLEDVSLVRNPMVTLLGLDHRHLLRLVSAGRQIVYLFLSSLYHRVSEPDSLLEFFSDGIRPDATLENLADPEERRHGEFDARTLGRRY